MKLSIKKSLKALVIVPALVLGASLALPVIDAAPALAQCTSDASGGLSGGANCAQGVDQQSDLFGSSGVFTTITNVMLFIIGAISVIMLIIGGIRYVVSGGDSSAVTNAKNTILYAVIGIIVSILAYAIVNFVIGSFSANNP